MWCPSARVSESIRHDAHVDVQSDDLHQRSISGKAVNVWYTHEVAVSVPTPARTGADGRVVPGKTLVRVCLTLLNRRRSRVDCEGSGNGSAGEGKSDKGDDGSTHAEQMRELERAMYELLRR